MTQDKRRRIRARDLYRFELIQDLDIAPDGQRVVYTVQRVERETEKKYSNLWLSPTDGGEPRRFTVGDHVDSQPRWSPDGRQIAFLSNRGDEKQPQIYLIPADGGEARPLTDLKGQFGSLAWSPDGTRIACRFRKQDADAAEREKDEQKKKLGIVCREIERVRYSLDGAGYLPQERWHLWMIDAESGEAQQLTDSDIYDEGAPHWSPDGAWLTFASNRAADPDFEPDADDLYVLPAEGGEMRKVATPYGPKGSPVFSPDGQHIAYIGHEGRGEWWKNDHLWVVPVDAEDASAARDLLAGRDVTVSAFTLGDMVGGAQMPPTWAADGSRIYVQIAEHGSTTLRAVSLDGDVETVIDGPGLVSAYRFDATRQQVVYLFGQMTDPGQIWLRDLLGGATRQLTRVNADLLAKLDLGAVEEVWFEGPDGNRLQGWILKPPDFDPARRYPAIIEIHGGPLGQYGHAFMHEFYYLAAKGYVVCFSNPRGGLGYGEEHARAIWGGWGDADYADLMAWADYVAARPYIDAAQMFVTGGSYGGYMTAWIIGHTDRFKAGVAQRCVSNLVSFWGSSDVNWVFQMPFGDVPPYESIDRLWESSPMKYIGNATTPTLVIHSANDLRCPLEQGQQLFVALKHMGVDTGLVIFPEESHGLSRGGRTDRRIARLKHIRRWFDKYLDEG